MPPLPKLKVLERCRISPAPERTADCRPVLPLTYFDLLFLHFPPVQRVFFFDLPLTKSQLIDSELPKLKLSLSLALRRFYPLAGSIVLPGAGKAPYIFCSNSDSVSFTVATSSDDFYDLSACYARAAARFRPIVPPIQAAALFSVQVTLFPTAGVAIATTVHHAAADGSAYTHFMKTWAAIAKLGESPALSVIPPPVFDRDLVTDPLGLEETFLKETENLKNDKSLEAWDISGRQDLVRVTFVFRREDLNRLARRVAVPCSPYALVCGLTWACRARARGDRSAKRERFGFVTGCRPRLRPTVPAAYFGNCLGICCVEMDREKLVGEGGAAAAAAAIWEVIRGLEKEEGPFRRAEGWVEAMREYAAAAALTVAGSPKLGIYGVDFGWGRARKVELVSIERTSAVALAESREEEGGMEVGMALPESEMEVFVAGFVAELAGD
ncbi:Malonyl-coenzyme A:anthocyanin 3-O-glucoside-6''-O-malonyltransferase [Apostasia shenzhenica]|uniref:Malonyl-coenzyme A:anthocyanin 3-O-glucoside-6''-O-malonyltransferase n=1 Tax=Apostasia shenzhenica TaxID=1088818 RepID=A0A2I0BF73_9ASPA|nr:Malonyl-coenzyme A:anthocyanin 3-O-glucoside-6''-O-malonyltransferase [Apostasia shenzhenica]